MLTVGLVLANRSLRACDSCAFPVALPPPTPVCQLVAGTTDNACRSDFYSVDLVAGRTYELTTCGATGCPAAGADYDSQINVYAPDCTLLHASSDWSACPQEAGFTFGVPTSGRHVLEVTGPRNGATGSYVLAWRLVCSPTCWPRECLPNAGKTCRSVAGTLTDDCPPAYGTWLEYPSA